MALATSGQISIGGSTATRSINLELGLSATTSSNMNSAALRGLAGVASGAISLSNFYGASNVLMEYLVVQCYNPDGYLLLDISNPSSITDHSYVSGGGYVRAYTGAMDVPNNLYFSGQSTTDKVVSYSVANNNITLKSSLVYSAYWDNYQIVTARPGTRQLFVAGQSGGSFRLTRLSYTTAGTLSLQYPGINGGAGGPSAMAANSDRAFIFVSGFSGSTYYLSLFTTYGTGYTTSKNLIVSSVHTQYGDVNFIAMHSSEDYLFTMSAAGGSVDSINITNTQNSGTIFLVDTLSGMNDYMRACAYDEEEDILILYGSLKVWVIDTSDPTNMVLRGSVAHLVSSGTHVGGLTLDPFRSLAFLGGISTKSLSIIDYSDPTSPTATSVPLTSINAAAGNIVALTAY